MSESNTTDDVERHFGGPFLEIDYAGGGGKGEKVRLEGVDVSFCALEDGGTHVADVLQSTESNDDELIDARRYAHLEHS